MAAIADMAGMDQVLWWIAFSYAAIAPSMSPCISLSCPGQGQYWEVEEKTTESYQSVSMRLHSPRPVLGRRSSAAVVARPAANGHLADEMLDLAVHGGLASSRWARCDAVLPWPWTNRTGS